MVREAGLLARAKRVDRLRQAPFRPREGLPLGWLTSKLAPS